MASIAVCTIQHHRQENLRARCQVLWSRVFDLVMADAVFARYKYHATRSNATDVTSVVACARDDIHVRQTETRSGLSYQLDARRIERDRRRMPDLAQVCAQAKLTSDGCYVRSQLLVHAREYFFIGMAKVDGKEGLSRNRIAGVRADL